MDGFCLAELADGFNLAFESIESSERDCFLELVVDTSSTRPLQLFLFIYRILRRQCALAGLDPGQESLFAKANHPASTFGGNLSQSEFLDFSRRGLWQIGENNVFGAFECCQTLATECDNLPGIQG